MATSTQNFNGKVGEAFLESPVLSQESAQWLLSNNIEGQKGGDSCGWSVALNAAGDILAVGAIGGDGGEGSAAGDRKGRCRIFKKNSAGVWGQLGQDIDGSTQYDNSGWAVSLNAAGDVVAITTGIASLNAAGYVRVYKYISQAWVKIGGDIVEGNYRPYSVSLNALGDKIIVASAVINSSVSYNYTNYNSIYSKCVSYFYDGSAWNSRGQLPLQYGNGTNVGASGLAPVTSVASDASGDIVGVALTTKIYDTGESSSPLLFEEGAIVFEYSGSAWNQKGQTIPALDVSSVSMSADGGVIALGVPNAVATIYDGNSVKAGACFVYEFNGSAWVAKGGEIAGENLGDMSGYSVSLNATGDVVAIGAPGNDGTPSNSGHCRVYKYNGAAWAKVGIDLGDQYVGGLAGYFVALNAEGDSVAIGIPQMSIVNPLKPAGDALSTNTTLRANGSLGYNGGTYLPVDAQLPKGQAFVYSLQGWNIAGLPPGLAFDFSTKKIQGTPTQKGQFAATVSGAGDGSIVFQIAEGIPIAASGQVIYGTIGVPFSQSFSLVNSPNRSATSWEVSGLPSWAQISSSTGVISGTPSSVANSPVSLRPTGPGGVGSDVIGVISIGSFPPPVITTSQTVLAWAVGQEFAFQFTASNSPTFWRIKEGSYLPNGVLLNSDTGLIYGSGTISGVWDLQIIATNSSGDSEAALFTIGIFDLPRKRDTSKVAQVNTATWAVSFPDPFTEVKSVNSITAVKTIEVVGGKTIETSSGASSDVALAAADGGIRYGDVVTFMLKFVEPVTSSTSATQTFTEVFPRLQSALFSIKGLDTDPVFFVTEDWNYKTGVFFEGSGYYRRYFVSVDFSNASLLSFLGDYEADGGTSANCLCEFQFSFKRHPGAGVGELDIITTQPLLLRVHRDNI